MPGVAEAISGSNKINSENISILREVLFKLTGVREQDRPREQADYESIRGQLSDTIQQALEIEELARSIFEAL
jgi:hypothetical protein